MAKRSLFASLLLLTVITRIESQFFDFFPNFQGFQNVQPATLKPIIPKGSEYEIYNANGNTRNNNKYNNNKKTTTTTTEKYDTVFNAAINKDIPFSAFLDVPERDNKRQFFNTNNNKNNKFSSSSTTTHKPARRNNSSQKNQASNSNLNNNNRNTNSDSRNVNNNNNNRHTNLNDSNRRKENENNLSTNNQWQRETKPIFDNHKNNNIYEDYYTPGPLYNEITTKYPKQQQTTKPSKTYTETSYNNREQHTDRTTYNYNQYTTKPTRTDYNRQEKNFGRTTKPTTEYTTSNPFFNRPGVKPPVYFNGPPITNKPLRRTTERPTDGLVFPEEHDVTKLITGPDEDEMSEVQKRRFSDLVERMCDKYKTLSQKQVQAIPLLPSPDAVRVNVSCAAPPTPLIVGGQTVTVDQYPHSAAVGWRAEQGRGYSWKCGGSLISDQFVLTAAHCTFQDRDNAVASGPPEVVQLGSSYLNGRDAKIYKISVAIRHPRYKRPVAYYDIALLKLANKVIFTDTIRPACIGPPPPPGTKMTATGWGRTEFNGAQSSELRGVSLPVWEMSDCARVLGTSRRLPQGPSEESQLCAGDYNGGKDTCQGDSGGPIQYRDGCAWRVAGATSLGVACGAPRTPALYALPSRYFVAAVAFT